MTGAALVNMLLALTPDMVNGIFEATGGLFLFLNAWRTYQAKGTKGISVISLVFFSGWGWWNLWYYPSLGQYWSFAGGCVIVASYVVWISLIVYYSTRKAIMPSA